MKLFVKSALIAFMATVIYSVIPFQTSCAEIQNDVFRLHILANSDSDADQRLKLKVRDEVLCYTENLFQSAASKEEAEELVSANLQNICNTAYRKVLDEGYTYEVSAETVNMYFPTRYYENYTLPSGMYDALRIKIGNAEGHNWWCVMYPSICLSASAEADERAKEALDEDEYGVVKATDVEYKFKVVELFEKLCSFFR